MSTKTSISTLEARLTVAEATIKLLQEQMAEMAEKSGGSSEAAVEKKGRKKREVDPDAPKKERSEKQKAQDEKREQIKSFVSDDDKKALKEAGYKGNVVFTLGAYITENGDGDISAEVVSAAVKHLVENPDYKSKTQKDRSEKSEKSSVASSDGEKAEKTEEKKRGRPKKEKTEKASEKPIEVVSASDDGDEKAEEWEFAGEQFYKLTKSNAVIDTDFEYIGIFDGKKIDRKAEMPASVKKYLEQFE